MSTPKDKRKFLLWAFPDTIQIIKTLYKTDNCRTQSEFVERAIRYYAGKINAENETSYLPEAMLSNMKSLIRESDNKLLNVIYKLAVELAMTMNIVAATNDIDDKTLNSLREGCINELKRMHGDYTIYDAIEWQRR